jgi:tRNA modification GTPase
MFTTDDTIVAIATPSGRGGIGVVRVSGPKAVEVVEAILHLTTPLRPRQATFLRLRTGAALETGHDVRDHVVATYFPAPHSYTGEHVVEISAHGSPPVLHGIVERAMRSSARLAEPGEFTLRAFLNGRMDLVQAEAVADLIDAVTPLQARAAFDQLDGTLTGRIASIDARLFDLIARIEASLDFPDEGYHFVEADEAAETMRSIERELGTLVCDAKRGALLRDGARVVIAGRPNVGKSSLFNVLLRAERAIVTSQPGTTRDLVSETVDIDGVPIDLIDTAGVRQTEDEVEVEGVSRARAAWATADLLLVLVDRSVPLEIADFDLLKETEGLPRLVVANKSDLPAAWNGAEVRVPFESVSSRTGEGFGELRQAVGTALGRGSALTHRDTPAVTNVRHAALLDRARQALSRAYQSVEDPAGPIAEEFVLTDLQDARAALEEVTGKRTSDDVLRHIFARFCVGK